MNKKNRYHEPTIKLHELMTKTSMLQASERSFSVPDKDTSNPDDEDATQAFSSRNAW